MTQEEITYNKNCLELLGYECVTPTDKDFRIYQGKHNNLPEMIDANFSDGFLNNWNWIMEVVEAIEKLGYLVVIQSNFCQKQEIGTKENKFEPYIIGSFYGKDKKEATVQSINRFLIWYNENKL